MKKLLLSIGTLLLTTASFSQVIFQVQSPSAIATNYGISWADPAGGTWTTPDLNDPLNSVTDTLMFVDVPGGDTIGCVTPFTTNLTSKIAVIYRGSCQFGSKALAAQNAGAVAVIIINNVGGAPVNMGAGVDGGSVTIPVVMISNVDGALLRNEIYAGNVLGFIGSKIGLFSDDVGAGIGDVVRARRFSNISLLSQDSSEFSVETGTSVINFGSQKQYNVTASVDIDFGGSSVYSSTVTIDSLEVGDTLFVPLGTFSQASYASGLYTMNYTLGTQNTDGDLNDNVISADFMINDDVYSYGRLNSTTKLPLNPGGLRPGTFTDYENCLAFDDPNASRVAATGMTFSASTNVADVLTNEFVEIRAYQWDDVFTDVNDPALDLANLVLLDNAFYVYTSDLQDSNVTVNFNTPISLTDNQRYLFCFATGSQTLFLGFDNQIDYTTTQATYLQPSFPSTTDAQSSTFLNGFGLEDVPAISVSMVDATTVGIDEGSKDVKIKPYPNPVNNVINIPVGELSGVAQLDIIDVTGKVVDTRNVSFGINDVLKVDVSAIANGSYVFQLNLRDGSSSAFNVVVAR